MHEQQVPLRDDTVKALAAKVAELYNRQQFDQILQLINRFQENMDRRGIIAVDPLHVQLIGLLKEGLPKNFANSLHQPLLEQLQPRTLLVEQFVVLFRGIGKAERENLQAGCEYLHEITDPTSPDYQQSLANSFIGCLLCCYTLAQMQRKIRQLQPARTTLNNAWERLQAATKTPPAACCAACSHGPHCLEKGLPLEVARGLAVVYRSLGHPDIAQQWFQIAEDQLPKTPNPRARSDFLYSFGYFQLENAYSQTNRTNYRSRLQRARELFVRSEQAYPGWAAPRARRAMCEHLLWADDPASGPNPEKICELYLDAEFKAKHERGEAPLTRYLCAFGAWLLAFQIGKADLVSSDEHQPARLRDGLATILMEVIYAPGPLQCHAFDARFLAKKTPTVTELPVQSLQDLLTTMGTWKSLDYANFILAELQSLEQAGGPRRRATITLKSIQTWSATARELAERSDESQLAAAKAIFDQIQSQHARLQQIIENGGVLTRKVVSA